MLLMMNIEFSILVAAENRPVSVRNGRKISSPIPVKLCEIVKLEIGN